MGAIEKPCICKEKEKSELQVAHHMVKVCDFNNKEFRENISEFTLKLISYGYRQYFHWVPMENMMISGSHIDDKMEKLMKDVGYEKISLMIGHPIPPPKCSPGNPYCQQQQ